MSNQDIWPEWDREDDSGLWGFYAEALLEPGWAGPLTDPQVRYLRDVLQKKRPAPEGTRSRPLFLNIRRESMNSAESDQIS